MIRKQVYIGREHQRKLRRVAARWGCTEAEVIRTALERLPDAEGSIEDRLAQSGLLAPPPADDDLPTGREADDLEHELESWLAEQREPLGLSEAVLEDRR